MTLPAAQWLTLARCRWRWLAWPALTAVALTALFLAATPRWYASHALLRIADASNAAAPEGSDAAAAATLAAAQLVASPQVVAPVAERLRLARAPEFVPHRSLRMFKAHFRQGVARAAAWARGVWTSSAQLLEPSARPQAPSPRPQSTRPAPYAPAPAAEAAILATVLSRLTVTSHPHSDLLDLTYRDHDPRLAAVTLNAISLELRARIEARGAQALGRQRAFLATQLAAASHQWQAAAEALVAFRATHPADAAGPRQSAAMARLMALSQALTQAEIDLWRQRAVVAAGRGAGASGDELGAGAQKRLADLRLQRARLAEQESRLAAQYGPAALPLVQARRALASVQASLRRYRRELLSGHQVSARADGWEQANLQQAVRQEGALLAAAEANAAQDRVLASRVQAQQDLYQQLWHQRRQLAIDQGLVRQAVEILAPARIPPRPLRSPWALGLIAAWLFGLLAGLAIVVGTEAAAPRVRGDNAAALGLPLLGALPLATSRTWTRGLDDLWITLLMAAGSDTTFLFTSTGPGEGKTAIARALGERLSQAGHSVLLVDCHFASPRLTVEWAAQPTPGLAEYLDGHCPPEALFRNAMAATGPAVLPAGQWRRELTGALASPAFARLLAQAARSFDWVFLDGGSVASQAEVRLLARAAEATLFIAAGGITPLAAAHQAVEALRLGAAKKLALILNAGRQAGRTEDQGPGTRDQPSRQEARAVGA